VKNINMLLFISGAEIVFVFFIVLLVFGADKIPSIARTLAKGMTQVRQATNEIKSEIQKSADVDIENPTKNLSQDFKKEVDKVKKDFTDLGDSIKRDL
jgi:sec-independent protein translocase protein TatA